MSHRAALMTGTAIKLLLIGARDEREINVGADLLSVELGKVGQQLQSLIGKLFTNIDVSSTVRLVCVLLMEHFTGREISFL